MDFRWVITKEDCRSYRDFIEQHRSHGKQSRNFIQWLGFSKYEIPLDSRIVKVLRSMDFPVPLSPKALADEEYYCFIEDVIQVVMQEVGEYPCVFDACAFASLQVH